MRILLINPPHTAIGSRIPYEHLPPLGLLAVGGPLIDAGHEVYLLDAEFGPLSVPDIVAQAQDYAPDAVLLGHSGSTSAHPTVAEITRSLRAVMPHLWIVYGGVFPTYHWRDVLEQEPQIDVVVRGEGEAHNAHRHGRIASWHSPNRYLWHRLSTSGTPLRHSRRAGHSLPG